LPEEEEEEEEEEECYTFVLYEFIKE